MVPVSIEEGGRQQRPPSGVLAQPLSQALQPFSCPRVTLEEEHVGKESEDPGPAPQDEPVELQGWECFYVILFLNE